MTDSPIDLTCSTATVVGAFVSNHAISASDLPSLIATVHRALKGAVEPEGVAPENVRLTRAQIRKSITRDTLISFEDGRAYRTLKRHLTTRGLTVAEYRAKWGLPKDYAMVAPSYSAARSAMAKAAGLGQKGKKAPPVAKATSRVRKANKASS